MEFSVIDIGNHAPSNGISQAFLIRDRWDDWGKYRTQFYLVIFDGNGQRHEPGEVKIGQFGLEPSGVVESGRRAPEIPEKFQNLTDEFFSLGQSESYYEALNELEQDLRDEVLVSLRDVARDLDLFERTVDEYVMHESLLRSVRDETVRSRLHRLAIGDATLSAFRFRYTFPQPSFSITGYLPPHLDFYVTPNSTPPTNIHVLIGRNGVGKSRCMQNIAKAVLGIEGGGTLEPITPERQAFSLLSEAEEDAWVFSELVSVSFSAFDEFDPPPQNNEKMKVNWIGLRTSHDTRDEITDNNSEHRPDIEKTIKGPNDLIKSFTKSLEKCRTEPKCSRWHRAVSTLCNDPLFAESNPQDLIKLGDNEWEEIAKNFFRSLSSGHKIVLLTITRLVELVHERTLILLDEPEGHLHPPLLSAFIRSLSDLLIQRNGVAIIATHSPVVLQEVPKSCVWMLHRAGQQCTALRPPLETFGENVGILTSTVFGLEVTTAGFHKLLNDAINIEGLTYEQLIERLGNQLGAEGKAIARALENERSRNFDA